MGAVAFCIDLERSKVEVGVGEGMEGGNCILVVANSYTYICTSGLSLAFFYGWAGCRCICN